MNESSIYAEAVVETFRKRAIRTALVVDDEFPTYSDLVAGSSDFTDDNRRRAGELQKLFAEQHIICAVENSVDAEDAAALERLRKSDFLLLDYQLGPRGSALALEILRNLARSEHFNTVLVYTNERDLDKVWLDIACVLRGGWQAPGIAEAAQAAIERLEDAGNFAESLPVSKELLRSYLLGGMRALPKQESDGIRRTLDGLGVAKSMQSALVEEALRRHGRQAQGALPDVPKLAIAGRCEPDCRWIQAGQCFVAILGKQPQVDDQIFDYLDRALVGWRPSLIEILISEIQNTLELEALVSGGPGGLSPDLHVGLFYYLLRSLGISSGAPDIEHFRTALNGILERVVETLRLRIVDDSRIAELAERLIKTERERLGGKEKGEAPRLFEDACALAFSEPHPKTQATDALFSLNQFFSSEPFRRGHLTTGTIFSNDSTGEKSKYWLCASPACDLEPRRPGEGQEWARSLHPMRYMVTVLLHPESCAKALNEAEHGKHIFLVVGKSKLAFSVVTDSNQPVVEIFFPLEMARVKSAEAGPIFEALRIAPFEDRSPTAKGSFQVVGQLRPSYASRILQLTGQHLSRIGVDFMQERK